MNNTSKSALDNSILQLKAGLLHQFLSLGGTSQSTGQVNSQSVLPSPTFQTSSASTVQLNGQQLKSRLNVEQPSSPAVTQYTYMVKFINPRRKSDFTIRAWYDTNEKFDTINSLRRKLIAEFAEDLSDTFQLGYLEPPSQAKRWLQNQRDLDSMYTIFSRGSKITVV